MAVLVSGSNGDEFTKAGSNGGRQHLGLSSDNICVYGPNGNYGNPVAYTTTFWSKMGFTLDTLQVHFRPTHRQTTAHTKGQFKIIN